MKNIRALLAVRKADGFRSAQDWSSAAALYQYAVSLNPEAFPIWVQLGHMRKELGEFDASEAAYLKASALRPDDADLHLQLGHLYTRMGDAARASRCYSRAADLGSTDKHALRFTPRGWSPTGQSDEALIAAGPFERGDMFRDRKDWQQAAICYRAGLEKEPNAFPYWVQLGNVLKEIGDFEGAADAYDRGLKLREADADLHLQVGHLKSAVGDVNAATKMYAAAVALGCRDVIAMNAIADSQERFVVVRRALAPLLIDEAARERVLSNDGSTTSFASLILKATTSGAGPSIS